MKITEKQLKRLIAEAFMTEVGDETLTEFELADLNPFSKKAPDIEADTKAIINQGDVESQPDGPDEFGQYPTSDPSGPDEFGQYPTSAVPTGDIFRGEKGDSFEYKDMGDGSYMFRDTRNPGSKFQLAKGGAVAAIDKLRKTGKSDWKAKAGGAPASAAAKPAAGPKPSDIGKSDTTAQYTGVEDGAGATGERSQSADAYADIRADATGTRKGIFSPMRKALRKQKKLNKAETSTAVSRGVSAGTATKKQARKQKKVDDKAKNQNYKDARGGIFTGRPGKIFEEGVENEGELLQEQAEMNRWKKIAGLNENKK